VVVWGKQAESCGEYLDKGSQIFVEGRLQTRDWESKDGQKRTATEVVAERVQFMSRTKGAGAASPAPVPAAAPAFAEESGGGEDDVPF
jgi:single-strand DNA-binding protein